MYYSKIFWKTLYFYSHPYKIIQETFVVLTGPLWTLSSAGQTFVATCMGFTAKDITCYLLPEISTSLEEAHLKEEELLTARGFQSPGASWMDVFLCELLFHLEPFLGGSKRSHFDWFECRGLFFEGGGLQTANGSGGEVTWQRWWRWCQLHSLNCHQMLLAVWENKLFYYTRSI